MAHEDTKRASRTPTSVETGKSQPPEGRSQPDNENQYGGGRQVGMPREQNRDQVNPPKASHDPGLPDDARTQGSNGSDADESAS